MNFISQDESASKLIQVVGGTQFLAVAGLRCPFPVGSLTLLPEPAHFPFQDFLVVPCVLWVFPSITSFYLQPEKVICSRDRPGVFVSYGCYDNKLPETVTYEHGHLFSYCPGDQMSDKDLSSWAKIKMLSGLISSGGSEGRESISLPLPPSGGFLHSLARGPFFHFNIHHFSLCFRPGTPAPPILTSPPFKDHCDDSEPTRIIQEPHLKVLTRWLLPLKPQVRGLGWSECEYIWGSFFSFPGGFPHNSVGKESACNAGDPGSTPGSGRSPREGIGYPLQYCWASLVAHLVKNLTTMWETSVSPWVGKIPWRRERLPTPVFWAWRIPWTV